MYRNLRDLCVYYHQDFEDDYESNVEPLDSWCGNHDIKDQKQLLAEMEMFLKEVVAGTKKPDDLTRMGMGYNQSLGGSWDWFREAITYLKKKIAEG